MEFHESEDEGEKGVDLKFDEEEIDSVDGVGGVAGGGNGAGTLDTVSAKSFGSFVRPGSRYGRQNGILSLLISGSGGEEGAVSSVIKLTCIE